MIYHFRKAAKQSSLHISDATELPARIRFTAALGDETRQFTIKVSRYGRDTAGRPLYCAETARRMPSGGKALPYRPVGHGCSEEGAILDCLEKLERHWGANRRAM